MINLKTKKYYIGFIFVLLSLGLIFGLIFPLFNQVRKNITQAFLQEQTIAQAEERRLEIKNLKKDYQKVQPDLEKMKGLFIDFQEPLNFVKFLEEIAATSDVNITIAFLKRTEKDEDLWPSLSFRVSFESSFENFMMFLDQIESSLFLIEIEKLRLNRVNGRRIIEEAPQIRKIEAVLGIRVYSN